MSVSAMSLKARIRNYAREHNIAAQVVLQNYMFYHTSKLGAIARRIPSIELNID